MIVSISICIWLWRRVFNQPKSAPVQSSTISTADCWMWVVLCIGRMLTRTGKRKRRKQQNPPRMEEAQKTPSKILQIIEHCMNIADSGCSGQFPLFLFRFCLCGWLMDQEQHKQEYHTFDTTPIWQQTLFVALHRLPQTPSALARLNHNFLFRRHTDGASVWGAFFSGVVLKLQSNCKHPKMIYNNLCYPRVKTKICQAQYNSFFRYLCVCFYFIYLLTY